MSEMQAEQRSAVVLGARNLGRAVIERLVSDGWAVTGVARSRSTLEGVGATGALALAVLFLADNDARSATHELQLTPFAENWTP